MLAEVADHFLLDAGFEKHQYKTQPGSDADFVIANQYLAINTGPFEVDHILIPAVFDGKLFSQVSRQVIGSVLGIFMAHLVPRMDINVRHGGSGVRITGF